MVEKSILKTIHSQFAENHNQRKGLFVQLLSALLVIFGSFGYVYSHTIPCIPYEQTYIMEGKELYSNSILLGVEVVVLSLLLLMNLIVLHFGYEFRRDQFLIMKIRKNNLGDEYDEYFGDKFNPGDKCFFDFLPDFYMIFYCFITEFQIITFIAICCKENLTCFTGHNFSLISFIFCILIIVLSIIFYAKTYYKYITKLTINYSKNETAN